MGLRSPLLLRQNVNENSDEDVGGFGSKWFWEQNMVVSVFLRKRAGESGMCVSVLVFKKTEVGTCMRGCCCCPQKGKELGHMALSVLKTAGS
jgi:hypothetical protein